MSEQRRSMQEIEVKVGDTSIYLRIPAGTPIELSLDRTPRLNLLPKPLTEWTKWDGRNPSASNLHRVREQDTQEFLEGFAEERLSGMEELVQDQFVTFVLWISDREPWDLTDPSGPRSDSWSVRMHLAFDDWQARRARLSPTQARELFARRDGPFGMNFQNLTGDEADHALAIFSRRKTRNAMSDHISLTHLARKRKLQRA